jgi:hypothetical protein
LSTTTTTTIIITMVPLVVAVQVRVASAHERL